VKSGTDPGTSQHHESENSETKARTVKGKQKTRNGSKNIEQKARTVKGKQKL
jgi:hypothetical protein